MTKKQLPGRGRKRGKAIAEHFKQWPDDVLTDRDVEELFENDSKLNHAVRDVERWAASILPGIERNDKGLWSYTAPSSPKAKTTQLRGQGTHCAGELTITLAGPQGSGKSLARKVLKSILPVLPFDRVTIREVQTR